MIQSLISRGKSGFLACFSALSNIAFPPFCVACKEPCKTKWFCQACWQECQPIDPLKRCHHCFNVSDGLCLKCKHDPELSFPQRFVFERSPLVRHLKRMEKRVLASFAIRAFFSSDLLIPDLIIPMPGSFEIANHFSEMLLVPMSRGRGIEVNQTLLVFNFDSSIDECKEFISTLKEFCPKRATLFHLFELN